MDNSRNSQTRRVEEEQRTGGSSSSVAGAQPRELPPSPNSGGEEEEERDPEPASRRRPREEESPAMDRQVQFLRERTSRVGDSVISDLWERFDNARRGRDAADARADFASLRNFDQDMSEYVQRIEVREQEIQHQRISRQYPPQPPARKGQGKGKGVGKQGKFPDKRPRTGAPG